jgi:hypothetical protein
MGCKKAFTREFLCSNLTATFLNTSYKSHREKVLFDNEKAMLIETQPYVAVERERLKHLGITADLKARRAELMTQVRMLDNHIYSEEVRFNRTRRELTGTGGNGTGGTEERRKFIHKCPITNCRGFLSTQWKCGSCDSQICNKCNEPKPDDTHQCDPNNVANMELLKKDSRPCPECAMMIFRIEGCPMMFCTNCNTPWDWNTGRKVGGQIHNPHYYQFIRNGGQAHRNHADIPCGGMPDYYELSRALDRVSVGRIVLGSVHRVAIHIRDVEVRQYRIDPVEYNRNLRIKYLLNVISEEQFKSALQIAEKKRQKTDEFYAIYNMFVNVCSDYLREIVIRKTLVKEEFTKLVEDRLKDITSLIQYFNTNLELIGRQYKCVYPGITSTIQFTRNYRKEHIKMGQPS